MPRLILALFLTLTIAATATADNEWNFLIEEGKTHLDASNFTAARTSFDKALEHAGDDQNFRARCFFFLARVEEEEGKEGYEPNAVAFYQKALDADKDLAAAANNAAPLLFRAGDKEEAVRLQQRAAETSGPRKPLYMRNLARFYTSLDRKGEAVDLYRKVLELQPDDFESEHELVQIEDDSAVATRLWNLVQSGAMERAQQYAVEQLAARRTESVTRQLMNIVALTIARQHTTPTAFRASALSQQLAKLENGKAVGTAVGELRHLLDPEVVDKVKYPWWSHDSSYVAPPALTSPQAFAAVARELGDQYFRAGRKSDAERTLRTGVQVAAGSDPDVVLALADFYFADRRIAEIDRLVSENEPRLFNQKGASYARGEWARIYRFHVALGTMFSILERDGSAGDPHSAIFQLERARRAAEENNRIAKEKIYVDPTLINRLASSYERTSRNDQAIELRLAAARDYGAAGRKVSAQETLEPVKTKLQTLEPKYRQEYDRILRDPSVRNIGTLDVSSREELAVAPAPDNRATDVARPATINRRDMMTSAKAKPVVTLEASDAIDAALAKQLVALLSAVAAAPPANELEMLEKQLRGLGVIAMKRTETGGTIVLRKGTGRVTVPYSVRR